VVQSLATPVLLSVESRSGHLAEMAKSRLAVAMKRSHEQDRERGRFARDDGDGAISLDTAAHAHERLARAREQLGELRQRHAEAQAEATSRARDAKAAKEYATSKGAQDFREAIQRSHAVVSKHAADAAASKSADAGELATQAARLKPAKLAAAVDRASAKLQAAHELPSETLPQRKAKNKAVERASNWVVNIGAKTAEAKEAVNQHVIDKNAPPKPSPPPGKWWENEATAKQWMQTLDKAAAERSQHGLSPAESAVITRPHDVAAQIRDAHSEAKNAAVEAKSAQREADRTARAIGTWERIQSKLESKVTPAGSPASAPVQPVAAPAAAGGGGGFSKGGAGGKGGGGGGGGSHEQDRDERGRFATDGDAPVTLDLGVGDVHVPSAGRFKPGRMPMAAPIKKKKQRLGSRLRGSGRGLRMAIHYPDGTKTLIRHMSEADPSVCLLRTAPGEWHPFDGIELDPAVALTDTGEPVWIQVAKSGSFYKGDHFELNESVFGQIVQNFNATVNHEVPVDFEHATEQQASEGSIPSEGAPAQGWVKQLRVQNGNLYGLVEWGDLAREYIRGKKYKYISPAIVLQARDRNSGKPIGARLTSVALTNKPFLDGMLPVAAKDSPMTQVTLAERCCLSADHYMPRIRQALNVHELATNDEIAEHLARLREHLEDADGDGSATVNGVKLGSYMPPLRELANVSADASWHDVLDVIEKLVRWGYGEHVEENPTDEMSDREGLETEMSQSNEIAVQLTEATAKVTTLTAQLEAERVTSSTLQLQLKDAVSKTAEATDRVVKLTEERDGLQKKLDEQVKRERETRVSNAFIAYKDAKKLTDDDKAAMGILLTSNEQLFDRLYPPVAPAQAHLLRNLTDGEGSRKGAEPPVQLADGVTKTVSVDEVATVLQRELGCDYGTALQLADERMKRSK